MIRACDVRPEPAPRCPSCFKEMTFYGGSTGYVCCGWKLLYRQGGWFNAAGVHVRDERLSVATRPVAGVVHA